MSTAALASELRDYLSGRYGTKIVSPADEPAVIARSILAVLLPLIPLAGPFLGDALKNFDTISTTFPTPAGVVIVLSKAAIADPIEECATLAHEHQHAVQIHAAGGVQASIDYLGSGELRARAEADAYATGTFVRWLLTGEAPSIEGALAAIGGGTYHLAPEEVALAKGVLGAHLGTMGEGLCINTTVAKDVLAWLRAAHPDAIAAKWFS